MRIYNIESLSDKEVLSFVVTYGEEQNKSLSYLFHGGMSKAEIIKKASKHIPIKLADSVECCLYCEERLRVKGLYCDEVCQTLDREEETA